MNGWRRRYSTRRRAKVQALQKMQAKKALRDAIIKQELTRSLHAGESGGGSCDKPSSGGDKVISDGAIESVIAGPGTRRRSSSDHNVTVHDVPFGCLIPCSLLG